MFRLAALIILLFSLSLTSAGQDTFSRAELEALEKEKATAEAQLEALENAEALAETDVSKLNASLITAAAESRRREEQAVSAERQLIDLEIRRSQATDKLFADEAALEDILAALASVSRSRPPALVVSPDKANASVRSAILMGDAAPALAERADALAGEIEALNRLERNIRREQARLDAAEATLALKQLEIERLAAAKRAQYEDVAADAASLRARTVELAAQADDLRALLQALAANAPAAPGLKPQQVALRRGGGTRTPASSVPDLSDLRPLGAREIGNMLPPVSGSVRESFGERRSTGGRAEGVTFVTRQGAQVVAPVDGVIEFANTFRSYGRMLILKTSDDYRVIITGLGSTYGTPGQKVVSGEPIGRMSGRQTPPPELYLELRKNDRPENPAGWLKR